MKTPNASTCIWRVVIELKAGMNPVSFMWYASVDYQDAFDYLATREHLINRRRKIFVKQVGSKHRHFFFDERFYEQILAREDIESDEYYEEDTADQKARVDFRRPDKPRYKPAVWKGIRRSVPKPPNDNDDDLGVLFIGEIPF